MKYIEPFPVFAGNATCLVEFGREQDGSAGLREALNSGAQIIASTIQKFPYICSETKVSGERFAVIIDEAHSSQSGKANANMKVALVDRDLDPDEPWTTRTSSPRR